MIGLATITAAIGAASSTIGLVDKIADQVEAFLTKGPARPFLKNKGSSPPPCYSHSTGSLIRKAVLTLCGPVLAE